jgi:hypothetical protein
MEAFIILSPLGRQPKKVCVLQKMFGQLSVVNYSHPSERVV